MIVELVCLDENVEPGPLVFRDAPFTIGAATDAQIALADREVSRRHCEVYEIDGTLWVRDLGSAKGTFVNGVPLREAPLMSGDMLTVGNIRFRVFFGRCSTKRSVPYADPLRILVGTN
jgi:pSer/pThr/pTyr-binding forkhead associated (FHA) protein